MKGFYPVLSTGRGGEGVGCAAGRVLSWVLPVHVCCRLFQSSLLSAVLGELPLSEGQVSVHGRIAYVSQQPWVFSGTVRSNILFGKKYEEDRYKEVIKACALEKVNNDFWAAYTQISNSDDVGLNSKVSWTFFLILKGLWLLLNIYADLLGEYAGICVAVLILIW